MTLLDWRAQPPTAVKEPIFRIDVPTNGFAVAVYFPPM
jgi:hypothetical protein